MIKPTPGAARIAARSHGGVVEIGEFSDFGASARIASNARQRGPVVTRLPFD